MWSKKTLLTPMLSNTTRSKVVLVPLETPPPARQLTTRSAQKSLSFKPFTVFARGAPD
jgi:hypothetical protein